MSYKHNLGHIEDAITSINDSISTNTRTIHLEIPNSAKNKTGLSFQSISDNDMNEAIVIVTLNALKKTLFIHQANIDDGVFLNIMTNIDSTIKLHLKSFEDIEFSSAILYFLSNQEHIEANVEIRSSRGAFSTEKTQLLNNLEGQSFCCVKFSRINYKNNGRNFFDKVALAFGLSTSNNTIQITINPLGVKHR